MNENHSPRRMTSGFLRTGGAAAVTTAVLLVLGVLGNVRIAGHVRASMEESMAQLESQFAEQEKQESLEESRHEETAVHEIQLTYMEEQLLNLVTERLEAKDFEGAARVLNNNENAFQELFFGKLADELCLYDGSVMKDEADGRGLVFLKATTVFYGDFQDGKPSGGCVALQALHPVSYTHLKFGNIHHIHPAITSLVINLRDDGFIGTLGIVCFFNIISERK